jgi:serine/threonine protein kinase
MWKQFVRSMPSNRVRLPSRENPRMRNPGKALPTEGMSVVYRSPTGTIVKVLDHPRPELVARARAMQGRWPSQPGLVTVLEVTERPGMLMAVLRTEEARNLREIVREAGRLGPAGAASVLGPVAEALDALDVAGVTYADVKTGNVLITPRGPLLAHTWLAFPQDGDTPAFRSDEQFAGTVDYVSPEVIQGALPDLRSDVYGLGCALFECLTGRVPFPRDSEDATLEAHMDEPPPAAPAAVDVIRRAMAKDPGDRYATAGGFAADLAAALS